MSERGVADHRAREDRISFLPDHLLCEILSDLPTNMAVRTSVLSKRWKSLWLSVPLLDLHIYQFPDEDSFVSFVHGFLHVSKESCLLKLKLAFGSDDGHMKQWIDYAVLHKVQHLDIECRRFGLSLPEPITPLRFYTCETLLHLKLNSVMLSDSEHVSLPRLKILHLIDNIYSNDAFLEKLISSCPLLEDLTVVGNGSEDVGYVVKVLRVRSQSLKTLVISLSADKYWDSEDYDPDPQVVIDAPGLNYLSLKDDEQLRSFVVNNLSSSAKVDIDVNFGLPDSKTTSVVRKFFTMLSSVRDMTIRGTTMKCLQIRCLCLKYEPLPQFPYMIRFHGVFSNTDLKELPNFLDVCPNLQSLVLELEEFKKNELLVFSSSSVPECLRTSLEHVELKTPISGAKAEMKLIKYFLENSAVLKKFKLRLGCRRMNQESIIFMELLRLKRCSASCEVVVELEEAIFQKFL